MFLVKFFKNVLIFRSSIFEKQSVFFQSIFGNTTHKKLISKISNCQYLLNLIFFFFFFFFSNNAKPIHNYTISSSPQYWEYVHFEGLQLFRLQHNKSLCNFDHFYQYSSCKTKLRNQINKYKASFQNKNFQGRFLDYNKLPLTYSPPRSWRKTFIAVIFMILPHK